MSSSSPPPSHASPRRALGLAPGWGVGMSHSGSYVSVPARAPSSVPVATEETASTHRGIRGILWKKKVWEDKALKAARAERERKLKEEREKEERDGKNKGEKEGEEKKETAAERARRIRGRLNELYVKQAELEKTVQQKWKGRMEEYEARSHREEEEQMAKLKEKHDEEMKAMTEKMQAENEADERQMREEIQKVTDGRNKRKADKGAGIEPTKKRQRVEGGDGGNIKGGDEQGGEATSKAMGEEDDDKEEGELESAKKEKELEHIMEEMNQLNKTKSRMVWLLKQVITAEAKMKMRAKMGK